MVAASTGNTGSVRIAANVVIAETVLVAVIVMRTGITGRAVAEAARPVGLAVKPTTTVAVAVHRGTVSRVVAVIGHRIPAGTVDAVMRSGRAVIDATEVTSRAEIGVGLVPRWLMAPATAVGTVTRPMTLAVTG